jgi:4-amino-4-deoxy-L-arabinose transferase-like glycosyltransferase
MIDLLGVTSILIISFICLIIGLLYPDIKKIIFVGLSVRIIFLLINNYIIPLPDSDRDAITFELEAWRMAQHGFLDVLINFPGKTGYFSSWTLAIFYSLVGRSALLAQSISVFFGMGTIFLGWLLAKKIWDNHTAIKVGWIIALFPSLILYSVLFLREVYIYFFLLIAMIGIVNWIKIRNFKSIILAISGFFVATLFHGGMITGAIIFLIIVVFDNFKIFFKLIQLYRVKLINLIIIFISVYFLAFYFTSNIEIPKLGTFKDSINFEFIQKQISGRIDGNSSYPKWTEINSFFEFIYKAPIRIAYFLFSPFLWDIKNLNHLIGFFDSILYMAIVFLVIKNLKIIWKDPCLRTILLILVGYTFVFGLIIGNFGTSVRHRSKFVIGLIILIAPFIPKISIFKKNKKTNKLS